MPENYFKMIAVEVFTVVSRCSFATVNTGNTSENVQLKNIINMSKCKTVTLRKRKIKNGTQYSLCLDYYPGYRDNATMKVITREALGIYIFAKPANQQERDFNARMMKKAEILRNRRYEAIFNENNGFFDKAKMKGDFLAYFKELADRKNIKWQHVYKHFERFVNGKCTFEEVDVDLCRKFMEYLLNAPQSIHTNQKLHINSAAGYWSAFRAVLHTAYRDGKMFVTTRMQKTKQIVHNPISDEAYGLLGERHEGLIFEGFKDKMLQGPLKRWLLAAGITKKITFHCTRHSFGSLHVEMGTDMAVIQAYMGHKNITTTQIYSKMAAQQMCEVVDKITLKRKEA